MLLTRSLSLDLPRVSNHHQLFHSSSTVLQQRISKDLSQLSKQSNTRSNGMKRKARYSRAQKRERKQSENEGGNEEQATNLHRHPLNPMKRRKSTVLQRIERCLEAARHTGSVTRDGEFDLDKLDQNVASIRIITSCDGNESKKLFPPDCEDGHGITVRIQPLLILDLNGILCHRSRHNKEPVGVELRPSIGTMAQTAIIPRTDLNPFLRYLDQHFCLAVWTSAKRRTAKRLLQMLVPQDVRQKLLFVWGQNYCESLAAEEDAPEGDNSAYLESDEEDEDDNDETVYEKRLERVWKEFPLWSAENSLLVDDSPEKCKFAVANALHPPAIHGRKKESIEMCAAKSNSPSLILTDENNERIQLDFFQQLVEFWAKHPHLETLQKVHKTKNQNATRTEMSKADYYRFLEAHASSHLGWQCK